MQDKIKEFAQKNKWQCFKNGKFTWFASGNCPNNGSSDCPLTIGSDSKCNMTDKDENEIRQAYISWYDICK